MGFGTWDVVKIGPKSTYVHQNFSFKNLEIIHKTSKNINKSGLDGATIYL